MSTADTPAPIQLNTIGQVAVYVEDLERAVGFYRDTLGMTFLFQAGSNLAFFDCGGVRLMLDKPTEEFPAGTKFGTSIIYYKVNDIQHAYTVLQQRGVEWTHAPHLVAAMPDHDLWMGFFKDSEANLVAVMHEVRPPAPRG